jgi:hypothetical protein
MAKRRRKALSAAASQLKSAKKKITRLERKAKKDVATAMKKAKKEVCGRPRRKSWRI